MAPPPPTPTPTMPSSSVTATARGTHVFEVRGFSGLRRRRCGVDGFVYSPSFTAGGLDWAIRYYPDGDNRPAAGSGKHEYVSAFVELVTRGSAAWARVGFGLLDQASGETVPVLAAKDPILFDASSEDSCTWGTGELARRSNLHVGSRFVLGDRLRIECAVDVCRDRLTFDDPPADALLFHLLVDDDNDGPDVILDVAGETFPAHASVLCARAPGLLTMNTRTHTTAWSSSDDGKVRISVDGDMPVPSFKALLHFVYTDTLPVVPGLDGAGNKRMIRHLLVAAGRYGMERLAVICERVLCKSLDVETVADTLAMADQHGFEKLSEACARFMASPDVCPLLSP